VVPVVLTTLPLPFDLVAKNARVLLSEGHLQPSTNDIIPFYLLLSSKMSSIPSNHLEPKKRIRGRDLQVEALKIERLLEGTPLLLSTFLFTS